MLYLSFLTIQSIIHGDVVSTVIMCTSFPFHSYRLGFSELCRASVGTDKHVLISLLIPPPSITMSNEQFFIVRVGPRYQTRVQTHLTV